MNKIQASETFNLRTIQRDYIAKALSEHPGHKYLIMDKFTMECVTVAFFRSELYNYSVFDTMDIEDLEDLTTQGATTGVFLIRPTDENLTLLTQSLRNLTFEKFFICRLR